MPARYPASGRDQSDRPHPAEDERLPLRRRGVEGSFDLATLRAICSENLGITGQPLESGLDLGQHRLLVGSADELRNYFAGRFATTGGECLQAAPTVTFQLRQPKPDLQLSSTSLTAPWPPPGAAAPQGCRYAPAGDAAARIS